MGNCLQLVNICKDLGIDKERGVDFVPQDLKQKYTDRKQIILKEIIPEFIKQAEHALEYYKMIPYLEFRIRFCLWPLWLSLASASEINQSYLKAKEAKSRIKISKFKLHLTLLKVTLLSFWTPLLENDFSRHVKLISSR